MTSEETLQAFWDAMCKQHTEILSQRAEIRKLRSLLHHYQMTTDNESKTIQDLMMENAQLRLQISKK